MVIIGEKIILRAIEQEDNSMLLELINDPDTEKMIGGKSWPVSFDSQMNWYNKLENNSTVMRCIIADKKDNSPLGTIIISDIDYPNGNGHIHIKMAKNNVRGKGYGTDAINTIVKYAFSELRLHCIFANIISYNIASIKLFEKCGFQKEGILRDRIYKNGQYNDVFVYSKLSGE